MNDNSLATLQYSAYCDGRASAALLIYNLQVEVEWIRLKRYENENYKVFITVFLSLVRSLLGLLSDAAHSTFAQ